MKTIAVIDDDIYIGNMLDELLTKAGYGIQRAYSSTAGDFYEICFNNGWALSEKWSQ